MTKEKNEDIERLTYFILKVLKNEDGRNLIECLKKYFISGSETALPYPSSSQLISQFGSLEAYLAFREGQRNVINALEREINIDRSKNDKQKINIDRSLYV